MRNIKNKISSESKLASQNDIKSYVDGNLIEKNNLYENLLKEADKVKFLLVKNVIKVILMSLVWAYGFFKLANFNLG